MLKSIALALLPLAILAAVGYVLVTEDPFERPAFLPLPDLAEACSPPVTYGLGAFDPRFGISEQEFVAAIEEAALVWNEEGGRMLLASSTRPMVRVNLSYDERQQAVELGESISGEQDEYERMKAEIESFRSRYLALVASHRDAVRSFEASAAAYDREVEEWNERGGAPPQVFARLAVRKAGLEREQSALNGQAVLIESIVRDINNRVDSLNALVRRLNQSAATFNATLGHDFDQGNYVDDGASKRITIYTFEDREELVRVLAHELGHALGIAHVENPSSLMYSYNIAESLELSDEDQAALAEACER